MFNGNYRALATNSAGVQASPLLTYRLGIHLGDSEYKKYSQGLKFNYQGQRNGVTLSISGSYQGESDIWEENTSFGVDLLANFGPVNIAGEWMQLKRNGGGNETDAASGFVKMSYHVPLQNGKSVEPVVNYVFLFGPTDERGQMVANELQAFAGNSTYLEFTLNYYATKNILVSLAYTLRDGDLGGADPEEIINNYFQQSGVIIQRGNYLGAGLVFKI